MLMYSGMPSPSGPDAEGDLVLVVVVEVGDRARAAARWRRSSRRRCRAVRARSTFRSGFGSAKEPPKRSEKRRRLDALADVAEHLHRRHGAARARQQEAAGRQLRAEEGVVALLAVDAAADGDEPAVGEGELLLDEDRVVVEREGVDGGVASRAPTRSRRSAAGPRPSRSRPGSAAPGGETRRAAGERKIGHRRRGQELVRPRVGAGGDERR